MGVEGLSEALAVTACATRADRLRSFDSRLGKADGSALGVAGLRSRRGRLARPEGVRVGVVAREELAVTSKESCLRPSRSEVGTGVVAALRERTEPGFGLWTAGAFLFLRCNVDKSLAAANGTDACCWSCCGMEERASEANCSVLTVERSSGVCAPGLVCVEGKTEATAVERGNEAGRCVVVVVVGGGGWAGSEAAAEEGRALCCTWWVEAARCVISDGGSSSRDSGATSNIVGAVCRRAPSAEEDDEASADGGSGEAAANEFREEETRWEVGVA